MKYGYMDTLGNLGIPPLFDEAHEFKGSVARVRLGKKFGFVNYAGEYILYDEFDFISEFNEGMAVVIKGRSSGYIDSVGQIAIPLKYSSATGFFDGLAAVGKNHKMGSIDKNGNVVIPFKYDFVSFFSEGLMAVTINDKAGFINRKDEIVIPLVYYQTQPFKDGYAQVSIISNGDLLSGLITKNGAFVLAPGRHGALPVSWKPGFLLVMDRKPDLHYYDITKKTFSPSRFHYIGEVSEGLRPVIINGKWGYINEKENLVIPAEFDYAGPFHNGFAQVRLTYNEPLYINKRGEIIRGYFE